MLCITCCSLRWSSPLLGSSQINTLAGLNSICGSKKNLAEAIDQALLQIAHVFGQLSLDQAQDYVDGLYQKGTIHRDLY